MFCKYCNKEYNKSGALKNHECRCASNPDRKLQRPKDMEAYRVKKSIVTKQYYSNIENRKKHSQRMRQVVLQNPDSYSDKNVVGRSKHFTVDEVRYNSTWEYKVAQYLTENNISWIRKGIKPISYYWNDGWHLYFPDFYLTDYDKYVEVKGYETERDRAKWSQSDKPIIIIKQKEMDKIKNKEYNIFNVL